MTTHAAIEGIRRAWVFQFQDERSLLYDSGSQSHENFTPKENRCLSIQMRPDTLGAIKLPIVKISNGGHSVEFFTNQFDILRSFGENQENQ